MTIIKQVTRLVVNPEYWDDKTHKLKTKMRLPDELRQSFNRDQVALEEYISNSFYSCEDKDGIDASWLESVLAAYYQAQAEEEQQADVDPAEDVAALFDDFVNSKERAESRRKQYMVIKRALLRYEMFKLKTTPGFRRFDVRKTDKRVLDDLTAFLRKYSKLPDGRLLPFIPAQQYNECIREVLRIVGIDRMVTIIDPLTGKEDKKPICEVAASHMARRTFIGNLYKKVQDPNIVASLSGHVEGSRAFSRYREIDKEIKTNVVKLLDD